MYHVQGVDHTSHHCIAPLQQAPSCSIDTAMARPTVGMQQAQLVLRNYSQLSNSSKTLLQGTPQLRSQVHGTQERRPLAGQPPPRLQQFHSAEAASTALPTSAPGAYGSIDPWYT
jgi:hypothetical protein